MDFLRQRGEHDLMIKAPEAVGDVCLDEPGRSRPGVGNLPQRGVAAPAGTIPVGAVRKLRLVERLQQQAYHLADQLIRPRWQTQWT